MLDTFDEEKLNLAAKSIIQRWDKKRDFLIRYNGGLTVGNLRTSFNNGKSRFVFSPSMLRLFPDIDIISTSSIHQGVPHVSFSLLIPDALL